MGRTATSASIRDAREDDLPALLHLYAQLNETPALLTEQHQDAFAAIQADPRQRLLVVELGGAVIANAALIVVPNLGRGGRPWAIIENVVVDEPARGGRVGEALMRYMIEEARAAGCYKVTLMSRKWRADAHRFYTRLGFEATSEGFRYTLAPD